VKYCPECGSKLPLGVERYCPNCGTNLQEKKEPNLVTMIETRGDIMGTGFSGNRNISGKDISYSIRGNVLTINLEELPNDILEKLNRITKMPIQIDTTQRSSNDVEDTRNTNTAQSIELAKQQISEFLNQLREINAEKGTQIEQINAGEVEISTNELLLKEIILKANEYSYKKEYEKAIGMYEQVTNLDPNNFEVWFNKGLAYIALNKHDDAILCFDKYLDKYPNDAMGLNNKAYALAHVNRSEEALPIIKRSLKINPHSGYAFDTIGFIYFKLGKYEKALSFYEKAIKMESNHVRWHHKALALDKLGRRTEAIESYNMAKKLKE
jgi:Putative Zn-dependent protease, contains TPR repeats